MKICEISSESNDDVRLWRKWFKQKCQNVRKVSVSVFVGGFFSFQFPRQVPVKTQLLAQKKIFQYWQL